MKKTLLSAFAICAALFANAQSFSDGDTGFLLDYSGTAAETSCLAGASATGGLALPNSGGIFSGAGGNITNVGAVQVGSEKFLQFKATATATDGSVPPIFYDIYSQASGNCEAMRSAGVSMDLSANPTVSITAKSDVDGAKLRLYVGTSGTTIYSTYNTGAGASIIWDIVLTTTSKTYSFDFTANAADKLTWDAWDGSNGTGSNSTIDMFGFTAITPSANYFISDIAFGDAVITTSTTPAAVLPANVTYGPNPSSTSINVKNIEVATLKVLDLNGNVVRSTTETSVDVAGLTSGLYFLQVNSFKPVKVMVK